MKLGWWKGQAQPETGHPTEYLRHVEIYPGIPKLRYLWTAFKPFLPRKDHSLFYSPQSCLRVYDITDQALPALFGDMEPFTPTLLACAEKT